MNRRVHTYRKCSAAQWVYLIYYLLCTKSDVYVRNFSKDAYLKFIY